MKSVRGKLVGVLANTDKNDSRYLFFPDSLRAPRETELCVPANRPRSSPHSGLGMRLFGRV